MTKLELEIKRRNALLTAWREAGVARVEGEWRMSTLAVPEGLWVSFSLLCRACPKPLRALAQEWVGARRQPPSIARALGREERGAVRRLRKVSRCPHVLPLLSLPPPEVLALAELLLLEARL
jgi:hypothetical protein